MLTFIVNPVSGSGRALRAEAALKAELEHLNMKGRFLYTEREGQAEALAAEAARDADCDTVVAVGGDGTCGEVAAGLMDTGTAMGIVPGGTGNDFIKTAGLPVEPREALRCILEKPARPVDLGSVNGRPFLNVSGAGFDVMVLDSAAQFKQRMNGLLPYLLGLLRAIRKYRPTHVRLRVDGVEQELDALICAVANGQFIGGGIPICPAAKLDDGRLDMVLVKDIPRHRIVSFLPGLMGKKILSFDITSHVLCQQVEIASPGMRVQVDGEISSMDRVTFGILPGRLLLHW